MGLSNNTTNFVLHALKSLMSTKGQCFTVHDVTKVARSMTDEQIDHDDVKQVIHNLYDQNFLAGYSRINHNVITADAPGTWAQLFVPAGANPYTYDPNQVRMSKIAATNTATLDHEGGEAESCDEGCGHEIDESLPADKTDFHNGFPPQTISYTGLMISNDPPTQTVLPPVNLGGQVLISGGIGGVATPTPAATSKPSADPIQQDSYLNNWNKPELRATAPEPSVLVQVKNAIVSKIKELLS